ncbi:hypothetical protein K440DRAFT_637210 [Wilcoxina mikolae CBS 423.85]|nr:hypothetical protein K440DRAFT_637210 [Wilcoxina mikolae CBS 423.85]
MCPPSTVSSTSSSTSSAPDRSSSHPFFPALPIERANSGLIVLAPVHRNLLPSPDSRRGIVSFLGFTDDAVDEILAVYNTGRVVLQFQHKELGMFPLASALFRVWEASHEWEVIDETEDQPEEEAKVKFAMRNGLRREFAEDINWANGSSPEDSVRRYVMNNVELLKRLWWQEGEERRGTSKK